MKKRFKGIDVGSASLHSVNFSEDGKPKCHIIKNETESIRSFFLAEGDLENLHVIFEHSGTYAKRLWCVLEELGITYSLITPNQSTGFAMVEKDIVKNDFRDAARLSRYGQKMQPEKSSLPSLKTVKANQLRCLIERNQKTKNQISNLIHAWSFDPQRDEDILRIAEQDYLDISEKLRSTQELLYELVGEEYEVQVELARTVKGIGEVISNELISATGGLAQFESAEELLKMTGFAVVYQDSGKLKKKGRICRTRLKRLRAKLYMGAWSARRHNKACKALYDRLRAKGKCHKVAMIAVCQKLLKQVFAVVKSGVKFDNDKYENLQNQKKLGEILAD